MIDRTDYSTYCQYTIKDQMGGVLGFYTQGHGEDVVVTDGGYVFEDGPVFAIAAILNDAGVPDLALRPGVIRQAII
ncbi:hypothetical protein [Nesterenkonia populi]|uniref:hypothetical protein n=1 Tax=Nesterenkonia populi TaxID=1591087 RepID=UPI0011BF15F2|nr:hypothetical protein [Nesterenkonia populi]